MSNNPDYWKLFQIDPQQFNRIRPQLIKFREFLVTIHKRINANIFFLDLCLCVLCILLPNKQKNDPSFTLHKKKLLCYQSSSSSYYKV